MKQDGHPDRNFRARASGDASNAILAAARHSLHLYRAWRSRLLAFLLTFSAPTPPSPSEQPDVPRNGIVHERRAHPLKAGNADLLLLDVDRDIPPSAVVLARRYVQSAPWVLERWVRHPFASRDRRSARCRQGVQLAMVLLAADFKGSCPCLLSADLPWQPAGRYNRCPKRSALVAR